MFNLQKSPVKSMLKPASVGEFSSPFVECIFVCKICRKEQAAKSNWQRHFNTHSDERPFACHLCSKSYKRSDQLTAHMKKQHVNEEKKVKHEENIKFEQF